MPRAQRARTSLPGHAKLARKPAPANDDEMMQDFEPEVAAPQTEEEPTVDEEEAEAARPARKQTKAAKQHARESALLAKITAGANPYSKSHSRRVKRAARPSENLVTGLSEVEEVLQQVTAQAEEEAAAEEEQEEQQQQIKAQGGKGQPKLTVKKRNRVLTDESARLPAVLANPAYASNPFATIRTHTLNNLAMMNKAAAEKKAKAKGGKGGK